MMSRRALAEDEHQRRAARRLRHRQTVIGLVAVGVTVLAMVAVGMDRLLRPGAFPIKELRLEGEFTHLQPEAVREVVLQELGDNYFSLDLGRIERAVEKMPWAYQAKVRRSWPNGLSVRVDEQHPVARWGETNWLNKDAEIIELEEFIEAFDLVQFSGPDSSAADVWRRYSEWSPVLSKLALVIRSIEIDHRFAWTVNIGPVNSEYSVRVLLGVDNHEKRMTRFVSSFTALKSEIDSTLSVDLRYPNGMAITRRDAMSEDDLALMRMTDE